MYGNTFALREHKLRAGKDRDCKRKHGDEWDGERRDEKLRERIPGRDCGEGGMNESEKHCVMGIQQAILAEKKKCELRRVKGRTYWCKRTDWGPGS